MDKERLAYNLTSDSVVIELGAYRGEFVEAVSNKFHCRVFAFEPIPEFFNDLKRVESSKVRIFNYGIGATNRREKISIRNDSSSLYRESTEGKYLEVEIRALRDVMAELGIDHVDLASINQEGAEFETLPHMMETGIISRFKDIMVQPHDFVPNAVERWAAISDGLSETHRLALDVPFIWQHWTRKE